MKTKITSTFSTTLLLLVATLSLASAEGNATSAAAKIYNQGNTMSTTTKKETQGNATSTAAKIKAQGNATSTSERNNRATTTSERNGAATSTEANDKGQLNAASHRSTVATFVQSLLDIANREGGIGSQVRIIAQNQNDSATTTASAITKVEERSSLRTFFFGSDYKNLGIIRSELATTSNNIAQLKTLLSNVTTDADRSLLTTQIQGLEAEQTKINTYIKAHEDVFSLFGWFTKLFVK